MIVHGLHISKPLLLQSGRIEISFFETIGFCGQEGLIELLHSKGLPRDLESHNLELDTLWSSQKYVFTWGLK